MLYFENDYCEGAHPAILQKLTETNFEKVSGYGTDPYCASAREKIRAACACPEADVQFISGGTQSNAIVFASMLQRWQGVVAAATGHVAGHEAGARACKFNMDTGCVELLLRDGRMISIDCTGVEDALDVTMTQGSELDYLIYNDPLGYADLILNGDPEKYLRNVAESHGLED